MEAIKKNLESFQMTITKTFICGVYPCKKKIAHAFDYAIKIEQH